MKAVILAGGKGTRLGDLTKEIPKPMLPVCGRPLLEYHLTLLKRYNITEVWIMVNYLKDVIISHFGNGEAWGVQIHYYEEAEPLGTTGGIKAIEHVLQEDFLVLYGDVMVEMDLSRLIDFHQQHNADATLVLHPNDHPADSDLVELDKEKRIIRFHAKPHNSELYYRNLVNAGLYVMRPQLIKSIPAGCAADFGRDIFPSIVGTHYLAGYNTTEYLKDMGTPERLHRVEKDIMSGRVERRSYRHTQKAIFLDRDGVLNDDTDFIRRLDDLILYPDVPEAVKRINDSDYAAIVITNQSVVARNLCTEDYLRQIHNKLETDLGKSHAWLDDIYYCPHHPHRGYPEENTALKIECECRKPKPGMLLQAAKDYCIDLSASWMLGDNERDIEAGRAAGCYTVGLATGKGLRQTQIFPDYFFFSLREAIDFILDDPLYDTAVRMYKSYQQADKRPYIIAIGGNTRSGKSTLTTYAKSYFKKKGMSVFCIRLDDWILPPSGRKHPHDIYQVFQLEKLNQDLEKIRIGEEVVLPGYAAHPMRKPIAVNYEYNCEDVIIVEGISAMELPFVQSQAHLKIFTSIDFTTLKERLYALYKWKGFPDEAIDSKWNERLEPEYYRIEKGRHVADWIL